MAQDLFSTLLNGKVETKKDYYPDGKLKTLSNYSDGRLISREAYYKSGKILGKAKFAQIGNDTYVNIRAYWGTPDDQIELKNEQNPTLATLSKRYFTPQELEAIKLTQCDNASGVIYEENLKNGKRGGVYKEYYCDGIIKYKDTYSNGELKNRKAYDKEGKLKFDQSY